jgi:tetratricopeptide (TPR) repeat protein
MRCLNVRVCFAIFLGICASCSLGEGAEGDQDLTADELVVNAASLYAKGKYNEAASLYRKFIADFGEAADAQAALRQMRYPLAICLVRLQRFEEASDAIGDALASDPPIDHAQTQELVFWKGVCGIEQEHGEGCQEDA